MPPYFYRKDKVEILNSIFSIQFLQWFASIESITLAVLLLVINVPRSEYTSKLNRTKNTIAISYLLTSSLLIFTVVQIDLEEYEKFSSFMMLIIVGVSSAIQSYSLINLLNPKYLDSSKFYLSVILISILSFALYESFTFGSRNIFNITLITAVVLFIFQSCYHIIIFDKVYKMSLSIVERYYDEDEDNKLRWIRFCYILMMLTNMFILVYLLLPKGLMKIYILFYMLFLVYFAGNFISFIGSHKLLLDAFGHRTLSGRDLNLALKNKRKNSRKIPQKNLDERKILGEKEYVELEKNLDRWINDRKYREYDKSREEIAEELGTTKEVLYSYFMLKVGIDFRRWRTNLRIEDAKKLLIDSKRTSINLIGEMVGFSDRSNFHRQFTKIVGCSPKVWRETDGHPQKKD